MYIYNNLIWPEFPMGRLRGALANQNVPPYFRSQSGAVILARAENQPTKEKHWNKPPNQSYCPFEVT